MVSMNRAAIGLIAGIATVIVPVFSHGQSKPESYPDRPVRLIVPFPPEAARISFPGPYFPRGPRSWGSRS